MAIIDPSSPFSNVAKGKTLDRVFDTIPYNYETPYYNYNNVLNQMWSATGLPAYTTGTLPTGTTGTIPTGTIPTGTQTQPTQQSTPTQGFNASSLISPLLGMASNLAFGGNFDLSSLGGSLTSLLGSIAGGATKNPALGNIIGQSTNVLKDYLMKSGLFSPNAIIGGTAAESFAGGNLLSTAATQIGKLLGVSPADNAIASILGGGGNIGANFLGAGISNAIMPDVNMLPGAGGYIQSIIGAVPIIGPIISGMIGGLGGMPKSETELQWTANTGALERYRMALVQKLQELSTQEPYASMLKNAQYTSGGWAVDPNWVGPTIEDWQQFYGYTPAGLPGFPGSYTKIPINTDDPSGMGVASGLWHTPTGTIEDFVNLEYNPYFRGGSYENWGMKEGYNLLNLLGYTPIFNEAFDIMTGRGTAPYLGYTNEIGDVFPAVTALRPETASLLSKAFPAYAGTWGNATNAWKTVNIPEQATPYQKELATQWWTNPFSMESQYPWANPLAAAWEKVQLAEPAAVPVYW